MKILVVGNGGREHALAWTLLRSSNVERVFCAPGNGGTATLKNCQNLAVAVDDFQGIASAVKANDISLVVVGPEVPLAMGITDYLQQQQIPVFGPTQAGARLESSKSWAKELMQSENIPTAQAHTFTDAAAAREYVERQGAPIVIKVDGLAAGKGVIVAATVSEAIAAIDGLFAQNFTQLVIEEFLAGEEVSVLALTDGKTIRPLIPAQDHKRIGEKDTGKNTGGMGAYAPLPLVDDSLQQRIQQEILQPILKALNKRGIDYRGVIYAGLMITPQGNPKVIEFNCRFGDPETQVVLPLLATPLEKLLFACVEQRLAAQPPITWNDKASVCVVIASGGYPDSYQKGYEISGLKTNSESGVTIFHAGTKLQGDRLITDGGRVLGVTALGNNHSEAISLAYGTVATIQFEAMYYRRDIGHRLKL
ncbi:phosphoribosylamine--glycine ligase [Myxosarcina sp. GI1]|uniref:phosphoribosylamine--glycine ligase n=1 Tax=Myxosarcina sp. GI1 TaxID=1541065 RepID=UPI000565A755|nr:phosphoribosylamine--glycine ligase [Myxosarcina sp. GI1]